MRGVCVAHPVNHQSFEENVTNMANLLAKKPLYLLMSEAQEAGTHCLKRTLGPFQLTALGIGAIIGAGIFVLSGLGAHYAGPGLMLSFVLSGLGCAFAALCYAEFAAMIPLAGSAYTYAYATLGELFAWIIGWDLTLEYAMGASTVSSGWSNQPRLLSTNCRRSFRRSQPSWSREPGIWWERPSCSA